jgi:hypothetical protein
MEQKDNKASKKKKDKSEKTKEKLMVCTKAPSAEHARSHDDDEPCDDGRTGELDEK